jgi:hypothetical protein
MKSLKTLFFALPVAGLFLVDARDASACGGCFGPPAEDTQVTSHQMILSVDNTQTTLWDQISYTGAPELFAWVLPTKGVVEIGLSSDLLFQSLNAITQVQVFPPFLNCPVSPCGGPNSAGTGSTSTGGDGGVTVLAQEVVGPFDTVQLSAADPQELKDWLATNNFVLPPDVAPIIDAYVAEGFNFLALKLAPGEGIDSMRPVRVTTPGASPVLPLRMVAAGTGAITPITLHVIGEGRYTPSNFASFTIDEEAILWDWGQSRSNYTDLRQAGLAGNSGKTWLIEDAEPLSPYTIENSILTTVQYQPELSGYGDELGEGAQAEAEADLAALYGTIAPESLWVTRLLAELPRAALGTDLQVGASPDQSSVPHIFQITKTVGPEPQCPPIDTTCDDGSSGDFTPTEDIGNRVRGVSAGGGGCAVSEPGGMRAVFAGLALVTALALVRRRRMRRSESTR